MLRRFPARQRVAAARFAIALSAFGGAAACAQGGAPSDDLADSGSSDGSLATGDGGAGDGGAGDGGVGPVDDSGTPIVEDTGGGPATKAGAGDVVISEIMYDPSGAEPNEEWLEIYNTTSSPKLLGGLTLEDNGGNTAVIAASANVEVPAKGYVVLVNSRAAAASVGVPGASTSYEYFDTAGPLLANSTSGSIALKSGSTRLSEVVYGAWFNLPSGGGASIELKTLTAAASGTKANWCIATKPWASGDKGTPGKANDCP